jgi:chromosome segregation ATPase
MKEIADKIERPVKTYCGGEPHYVEEVDIVEQLHSLSGQSSDDLSIIGATAGFEILSLRQRLIHITVAANGAELRIEQLEQQLADKNDALRDAKATVETWLADNQEKFESLEQQLVARQADLERERERRWDGNRLASLEYAEVSRELAECQAQVKQAKREALLEAADWFESTQEHLLHNVFSIGFIKTNLRRMAKELE